MSEPPRRGPVSTEERLRNLGKGVAGSPQQGRTRYDRRPAERPTQFIGGNVVVIIHGDDGTVPRPSATIVMWVGAATPDNAVDFDFFYPATI